MIVKIELKTGKFKKINSTHIVSIEYHDKFSSSTYDEFIINYVNGQQDIIDRERNYDFSQFLRVHFH
jgi:hypothetical protein